MNDVLDKVEKQIVDFYDSGIEESIFSIAVFILKCINNDKFDGDMGYFSDHMH